MHGLPRACMKASHGCAAGKSSLSLRLELAPKMCRARSEPEFLSACLVSAAHLTYEAKHAVGSKDLTGLLIIKHPHHLGSIW